MLGWFDFVVDGVEVVAGVPVFVVSGEGSGLAGDVVFEPEAFDDLDAAGPGVDSGVVGFLADAPFDVGGWRGELPVDEGCDASFDLEGHLAGPDPTTR